MSDIPQQPAAGFDLIERLFGTRPVRFTLENGVTVIVQPDFSAELVAAQVWVKTGSIHEGGHLGAGLSHYLEHMMFKGTTRRTYAEISGDVHGAGGQMNAYTTFDRTVYYVDTPVEGAETALDVLADITLGSTLPGEEVRRERDVILREIDMGLDDPHRQLSRAVFETAFRSHPYRYPVIGLRPLFEQVGEEALRAYYRERYAPNNLVVVMVGALEEAQMRDMAEQYFGGAPMRALAPPAVPQENPQLAARETRLSGEFNLLRGGRAYRIPSLSHADAPALDLLSNIIGQGDSALLWQRLREERRLVHEVDVHCWNPGPTGLFWISWVADADKQEAVEAALDEELARIVEEGVEQALLDKARRQTLVSEINGRKTMTGQAGRLGAAEVVVGDLGFPRRYLERLRELEAGDLAGAMERHIRVENSTTATLAPTGNGAAAGAPAAARRSVLPDFEQVTFDNGARLLVQPRGGLPKVHLRVAMLGGPLYEAPEQRGATSLLATLLTKDTQKRDAAEVARTVECAGGVFNEFAGNNSFGFAAEFLSEDLPLAADLLGEALLRPAFSERTLEVEREGQLAEIADEEDEVVEFGRRALRARFFGKHPLAEETIGRAEAVANLGLGEVRALHRELVCSGNVVIAASGDFEPERLQELIEPVLRGLPDVDFAPRDGRYPGPPEAWSGELEREREQAVVFQGYPDVGAADPRFHEAELLDEVFSGMSSRLFARVREEKGMAYFVASSRIVGVQSGLFYLFAGTSPELYGEVLAEMEAEVERIRAEGPEAREFARCQARLIANKQMGQQTPGARAMQAALNALYGLPVNSWRNYAEEIRGLKPGNVRAFARDMLDPARRVTLVVRPPKR